MIITMYFYNLGDKASFHGEEFHNDKTLENSTQIINLIFIASISQCQ